MNDLPDNVSICSECDKHTNDDSETKWDLYADPYCEKCYAKLNESKNMILYDKSRIGLKINHRGAWVYLTGYYNQGYWQAQSHGNSLEWIKNSTIKPDKNSLTAIM